MKKNLLVFRVFSIFVLMLVMSNPVFAGSNSNKVKTSTKFDESSPLALVIYSVRLNKETLDHYSKGYWLSLVWKRYNPKTENIVVGGKDRKFTLPVFFHEKNKNKHKTIYKIFRVTPGTFVLETSRVVFSPSLDIDVTQNFHTETTSFQVEPGKIYFLGDYEFSFPKKLGTEFFPDLGEVPVVSNKNFDFEIIGYNTEEAEKFLKNYKKINGGINILEFKPANLHCKEEPEKVTTTIYKIAKENTFCTTENFPPPD